MLRQGINGQDWRDVQSKIKQMNMEQLIFLTTAIKEEEMRRTGFSTSEVL